MGAHGVKRGYDGSRRQAEANERRSRVVDSARSLFLARGFARTTVAAVAHEAGVSVETVYKAFGGKPGLVRAVWEAALSGSASSPAESRSDTMSAAAGSGAEVIEGWLRLALEVAPLVGPVLALVRAAALVDPEAAGLLAEIERGRSARMLHNARVLAARGELHPSLTPEQARDLLLIFSAEFYGPLVGEAGWDEEGYVRTMTRTMVAALVREPSG